MNRPAYHVLFLCTGNSARSILAEALLNQRGAPTFLAFSAGSHPTGRVNPGALACLKEAGLPTEKLRSKSWEEFALPGAPRMDFVLTVCDAAAQEICPVWPGHPVAAHWGLADPAAVTGSPERIAQAFREAFLTLERRIGLLLRLPSLDRPAVARGLEEIGRS